MSFLATKLHGSLLSKVLSDSSKIIQVRYAARKGTRERKQKKKVKVQIEKIGFIPHIEREKEKLLASRLTKKFDDSWKRDPIDNVYRVNYFKWIVYPFAEAVQAHRETHHPEMYNKPDASLYVTIELNMQAEKKTRFVDNFTRIAPIPHRFDHGEIRTVLAFAKSKESQEEAREAGANLVGGPELVKEIQNGRVSLQDFQHYVAHPDILPELVPLRGLMKRKFPNPRSGTLDPDLRGLVLKFLNGIQYKAAKDEHEKDFGTVETAIGTLDMDAKHLEENFASLLKDILVMKPKREGHFISRCLLWSPPSREKLKVGYEQYVETEPKKENEEEVTEAIAL